MRPLRALFAVAITLLFVGASVCQERPTAKATTPAPAPATAIEHPLLWRIELPVPSYLFGTIHLPDPRIAELPEVVDGAIGQSGALFTEIPMDLAKMAESMKQGMLPKGTSLADVLGAELYARTQRYVEAHGASMAAFDHLKPWMVTMQLMVVDKLKQMAKQLPLDLRLYNDAKKRGEVVGGLETVEGQLAVFEGLSAEEHCTLLRLTLDQLEKDAAEGRDSAEDLMQMYLHGDPAAIEAKMNDLAPGNEKLQAKLEQRLLFDRNVGMVDRIVDELQRHPDRGTFIAVGAAHYPGPHGILELLRARGYAITRLELQPDAATAAAAAAGIDGEIARREADIKALRARREKLPAK